MRLVIVSNRLPVVLQRQGDTWSLHPGPGGLVTALSPILRERGGVWIGWPGLVGRVACDLDEPLSKYGQTAGFDLVPVPLDAEELEGFYNGFSNEIVWPLFHDLQSRCNFVPEYWDSYRRVTQKFGEVCGRSVAREDFIWVQDYHLMGLGQRLREIGTHNPLGFFLHIPFPPPDIFCKLPWRQEVLKSLLWYNVMGVQTPRDLDNLLDCIRKLLPGAEICPCREGYVVRYAGRQTLVGSFPIGIDYEEFASGAAQPEVASRVESLRADLPERQIVLGIDRLDYTKGIPFRLKAFRLALQRYPELHRKMMLLQVVVPSRESVPQYQVLKDEVERLVTRINGEFTQSGWVPIHYVFRSLERRELLAFYRLADVAFVTPLKDGMNLVAKEYCAAQVKRDGVLILSEFAGAAVQLGRDALLVNPYDLDGVASALHRAVRMSRQERQPGMRRLRRIVRQQNVHWWAERFLNACGIATRAPCRPQNVVLPLESLDTGEAAGGHTGSLDGQLHYAFG